MARVAVLTHVKESTVVEPPSATRSGPRMAWSGGKIVSNKAEALRKFYERKLASGATLTPEQHKALEASLMIAGADTTEATRKNAHRSKHDGVHKVNPAMKRITHRTHVKAQGNQKKSLVVNGRVVGPRVSGKANASRGAIVAKMPKRTANQKSTGGKARPSDSGLALQDKLGMSLDALMKRNGP